MTLGRPPHRARGGHDLLIRRLRQLVQDGPSPSVRWADIPQPSMCVGRRPAAWLQRWLQSWRNAADPVAVTVAVSGWSWSPVSGVSPAL